MNRRIVVRIAGVGLAGFLAGCAHTRQIDGVEVGEPSTPIKAPPLDHLLTEPEIIQAAQREAERRRIPLHEFKGPHIQPSYAGDHQWCVIYSRDLFPGDHFMVVVNARTGETTFVPGE